jgi:hypothetical protein
MEAEPTDMGACSVKKIVRILMAIATFVLVAGANIQLLPPNVH